LKLPRKSYRNMKLSTIEEKHRKTVLGEFDFEYFDPK
jgi:hypothetical protein